MPFYSTSLSIKRSSIKFEFHKSVFDSELFKLNYV